MAYKDEKLDSGGSERAELQRPLSFALLVIASTEHYEMRIVWVEMNFYGDFLIQKQFFVVKN
ncbi:hypothetical protein J6590_095714 [Homalodisca vitripennis]|nr:hypothetical protein J6590_095714 [Homalodisca vitripennis]